MSISTNAAAYWQSLRKAGLPRLLSMAIVFDAVRRCHSGQFDDFFFGAAALAESRVAV